VEEHILDQFYTYSSNSTRDLVIGNQAISDQLLILRVLLNDLFKGKIVELSIQYHRIIGLGVVAFVNIPKEGKEFPTVMSKLREAVINNDIEDISTFVLPVYVV
jgi:hypothetical protein